MALVPLVRNRATSPFVPAPAGTQTLKASVRGPWVPACAGTNGVCCSVQNGSAIALAQDGRPVNGMTCLTPHRSGTDSWRQSEGGPYHEPFDRMGRRLGGWVD